MFPIPNTELFDSKSQQCSYTPKRQQTWSWQIILQSFLDISVGIRSMGTRSKYRRGRPKLPEETLFRSRVSRRKGSMAGASSACLSLPPASAHCGSLRSHFSQNNNRTNNNINAAVRQSCAPLIGATQTVGRRIVLTDVMMSNSELPSCGKA